MIAPDPVSLRTADRDLAQTATVSSILYLVAWLVVIYTTEVSGELPLVSISGIVLLGLAFAIRLVLGAGFEKLYERMPRQRWQLAYCTTVAINSGIWGVLNAIVTWHYFPAWPAFLITTCTAGLAAGGTTALHTHLRLSRIFIVLMLVPGMLTLTLMSAAESTIFGLIYLLYFLYLTGFGKQLNNRYWEAMRNSRLLEEKVEQLQEARIQAEAASHAKSQFLANMSHEIRTPLNAVLGFAQLGRRTSQDTHAKNHFSRIQASGQHLLGIINEILDLSKLDSGKLRIDSLPFDLAANVNLTVDFVRESARGKDLGLAVEYDPGLPSWVTGDPHRLRQILVNLLGNAIKFTRQGEVRLAVHPRNTDICFSVIDSGIGMDSEQVSRIFMAFEQADGTTTRRYGGTGLGLAISRDLAMLMGGEITVESTPGAGSTFTLCLPLTGTLPAAQGTDIHEQPAENRLAGMHVLAVEDDELNRMVIREMLEIEGASVVLANNGQQAMDRLVEEDPAAFSIVIMDVQMPLMDGYEATRQIHAIAPYLPVIGLTAHAMEEERERCLAAGMMDRVTKPIDAEDLVMTLQKLSIPGTSISTTPAGTSAGNPPPPDNQPGESLPGIDIDGAYRQLKCDWPALKNILVQFYIQHRESSEKTATLITRGNIEDAREIAHGIRGSSGYFGAWKLHRESGAMEEACKTGNMDTAKEKMTPFCAALDEVINGLEHLNDY